MSNRRAPDDKTPERRGWWARLFGGRVFGGRHLGGLTLALLLTVAAMAFLIGSVVNLMRLEDGPVSAAPDHMLWTYYQSLAQTLRLDAALAHYHEGVEAQADFRWQYDLLISRLDLLTTGPQLRHAETLGLAEDLQDAYRLVLLYDLPDAPLTAAQCAALAQVVEGLADTLNLAANRANRGYWASLGNEVGEFRQIALRALMFMLAAVAGVAVIGTRFVIAERRAHAARHLSAELERERERAAYFRDIAAVTSHQIRTPLAVIDSTMQRALRNPEVLAKAAWVQGVERVRLNIRRALLFIDQAMLVGAIETGRARLSIQVVPLSELLLRLRAHEGLRAQAERLRSVPGAPVRVRCDVNLVMNAACNIIENALKYTPEDSQVELSINERGGFGVISVRDQGPGIPVEEQQAVFERFHRGAVGKGQSGSGLGLWVARRLIEVQGGQITLYSDGHSGARFDLCLPLAKARDLPGVAADDGG